MDQGPVWGKDLWAQETLYQMGIMIPMATERRSQCSYHQITFHLFTVFQAFLGDVHKFISITSDNSDFQYMCR